MIDQENTTQHTSILVVFANPRGSSSLRLGSEERIIRECLDLSEYRDNVSLDVRHAATPHDVRRALLRKDYRIVQFSGHGTGDGLVLENAFGEPQLVPQEALADFLSKYSPPIECVILNACYTDIQGELISLGVPYTISISGEISDAAAKEFTRGFYDAIGAGRNVEFAFREGCHAVSLTGLSEGFQPVLFSETRDQEHAQVKIVSQHQVRFDKEEEKGFLDYVSDATESFEISWEILDRITDSTIKFREARKEDLAELMNLRRSGDREGTQEFLLIISHTAQTMETFAQELNEETPRFRDAFLRGIDCFGKAMTLLTGEFEFDTTSQKERTLTKFIGLRDSIVPLKVALVKFRQLIADTPSGIKEVDQARRDCLAALANFDREIEAGFQLMLEVQASTERLVG